MADLAEQQLAWCIYIDMSDFPQGTRLRGNDWRGTRRIAKRLRLLA